ncbi:MAG: hypothetical protein V3U72_03440 [Candidatus Aenigmarchaeota archaeon]
MDFGRIFKTGAVSGSIYGILQGIVSVLSFVFYREQIIELIRSSLPSNLEIPITVEQLADIGMISAIPGSIIGGIIAGIIVSFIFALMYNELMGKDSKRKGLFLCILLAVAVVLGEFAYQGVIGGIFMIQTRFVLLTPLNIIFFLVFGYVMGKFYDKFEQKAGR